MSAATSVDLPGPGRPGDPDEVRPPGHRVEPPQRGLGDRRAVLDRGQQPGQREPVARDRRVGQRRPPAPAASAATLVARSRVRPQVVGDLGDRRARPEDLGHAGLAQGRRRRRRG